MTLIDPVALVSEILESFGHPDVNSEKIESRALSSEEYIFVQEIHGRTPHIRYSDRPSIQIIVYTNTGKAAARSISYRIAGELAQAHGKPFSSGGLTHVSLVLRPTFQEITGLPYGVARAVAHFDLGLTAREKWS